MSRAVSVSSILTRAARLANVVNDPAFDQTYLLDLMNAHAPAVYDYLVAAAPSGYYAADANIDFTAGTIPYAIPNDFMSLVEVRVQETSEFQRPLDPMESRGRQHFRAPVVGGTIVMEYVPTCPSFTLLSTFNGVDGWDELIAAKMARDILVGRQGDVSTVMNIIAMTERRILAASKQRDRAGPKYLTDYENDQTWPWSVQIDAYRLRGDYIEIYSALFSPFGW